MEGTLYTTEIAILKRAQEACGIPLKEIDKTGRLATGKGAIGTVIEESWFGYHPNSEAEPDFPEAGVELKVTPYIRKNGHITAKERLVCNIINYMEEYKKAFSTSSFIHKCGRMLLMSYEHLPDTSKGDFTIDAAILFSFPKEDLVIIQQDWETIMGKVRRGEAHLISEGDTLYLGACTKGANSSSVRPQPKSDIPAKQRAFCLKSTYMTYVLNTYIYGQEENERIVKDWRILQSISFESYIISKLSHYYGYDRQRLVDMLGINSTAKNLNEIIIAKMLGARGRFSEIEEFSKANIIPKTIRVRYDGWIKENMSFPAFDFIKLSQETWEESTLYNYLAPARFLFIIFEENSNGNYVFKRAQFWNIPEEDLEQVHIVWERTAETIRRGVRLIPTSRGVSNDLPKQTENRVAHVRPHGRNADDKLPLPDGRMMTKQCFWLNNSYIRQQIQA